MGELPRPALPPGPLADMFDELHALHHWAGWPSLRKLAREIGCSHTTVSVAFSEPRLPRWGLLELIVESLSGDVERFHELWLEASRTQGGLTPTWDQARPTTMKPATPRQLPAEVANFSGRDEELAMLDALVDRDDDSALPIGLVTGMPGVGKTSLVVRWAHRIADRFPDGQLHLNLRGYDPDKPVASSEALESLLRALGVEGEAIPPDQAGRAARYRSLLAGKRVLVVLDNAYSTDQVRDLLPGSPTCLVMVTSRDSLPGLVIRHGAARVSLGVLEPPESAQLLCEVIGERATSDPRAVTELAAHCAHLPLALRIAGELAVTQPATPLRELADELADASQRLDLLAAGQDDYAAVRSVLSWSRQHLTDEADRTFQLLGLHPGRDFDASAVAALADAPVAVVRRHLAELWRASLLEQPSPGRFALHDLLRAYAKEQAADYPSPLREEAVRRLVTHAVDGAVAAVRDDDADWLEVERRSLLAVAPLAVTALPEVVWKLASALGDHLDLRARYLDAITLFDCGLRAARSLRDPATEAAALARLGHVRLRLGRYDEARQDHLAALAIYRDLGDPGGEAGVLDGLGSLGWRTGRYGEARDHLSRALEIHRELGDRGGQARAMYGLGIVARRLGDPQQAIRWHGDALTAYRDASQPNGEGNALNTLGLVYAQLGRFDEAIEHYRQSRAIFERLENADGAAVATVNLAETLLRLERYDEAAEGFEQAHQAFCEVGNRAGAGDALRGLGCVRSREGRHAEAIASLQSALDVGMELDDRSMQALVLNDLGEAQLAARNEGDAREAFARAAALSHGSGERFEEGRAAFGLARLADDPAEARQRAGDALAIFDDIGVPEAAEVRAFLDAG